MKNLRNFRETCSLCELGLLHLYGQISSSGGYFSTQKRNSILRKWLKNQVKKAQYAGIKKIIKELLVISNQPVSVEFKLWDLNALNQSYKEKFTDQDLLFVFFSDLYNIHKMSSRVYDQLESIEDGIIYVSRNDLEGAFDDKKAQCKALRISVSQETLTELLSLPCVDYSFRLLGPREDVGVIIDLEMQRVV